MDIKERCNSIQIENMKYINGMNLEMVYAEKNGEAILYGKDSSGVIYTLDVLSCPKNVIIGYRVEYAWWKYPVDELEVHKEYAKTLEQAREILRDIISRHYHNARIVPIYKRA